KFYKKSAIFQAFLCPTLPSERPPESVGAPPCIVNSVPANLRKDTAPWIRRSMCPPRRKLRHELTPVGRTGVPISTAESREETHLGLSSNPVAPIILRNEPFGEYVEGLFHCEDASYRSTSVFKWHCTMVEITRKSDGTPLFVWRNVVQIPSPVLRWQLCVLPTRLNEQWAMDFMHDSLADGTTFRGMPVIDLYSGECLAAVACRSFSGADVASVLAVVGIDHGALPKKIRVDNGTEFTSKALDHWAYWNHVELDFSRPGKPADN